jgi:Methyltransferase FkbM domain
MVFDHPALYRTAVRVRTLDFGGLVRTFAPDVVKVDTEGSEYEVFDGPDLTALLGNAGNLMWVEFHEAYHEPYRNMRREILNRLSLAGWSQNAVNDSTSGHVLYLFRRRQWTR